MDERTIRNSVLNSTQEEKRLYRLNLLRFTRSHGYYVVFFISSSILQIVSILLYTNGLPLHRHLLMVSISQRGNDLDTDYIQVLAGIVYLLSSLVLLIIITKLIPSIIVTQMVPEFVRSIIKSTLLTNFYFNGIYFIFNYPTVFSVWCLAISTATGIIIGCWVPIFKRYNMKWIIIKLLQDFSDYWSLIGTLFLLIHSSALSSAVFIVWEERLVSFLLITFGLLTLYEFVFIPKRQLASPYLTSWIGEQQGTTSGTNASVANANSLPLTRFARLLGGYHSIVIILSTKIASLITMCREEQSSQICVPTFTDKNNYSWWALLLSFTVIFMAPSCIKGYYNLSSSYQAAAPIWIDFLLKGSLAIDFVFWCFLAFLHNYTIDLPFNVDLFKFSASRIIVGFTVVVSNIGWVLGPLCIKLNLYNTDMTSQEGTILGFSNIYGAPFFLLIINAFITIFFFNKPLAQFSLMLMLNQILSLMEIIDLLKLKENLIGPVVLALLAYQQFFSTGHQTTFDSIQFDIGFILTDTVNSVATYLPIALNTFGPCILTALSAGLLTLWRQPPDILKPQTLLGRIVSSCGLLLTYNTVMCLSSFIWLVYFYDHVEMKRIHYPRFLFSVTSLLVTEIVLTFGTIALATGRLIRHINYIFWK